MDRCQCEVSLLGASPKTARLVSLAALNPTLVIKTGNGAKTQLKQGLFCIVTLLVEEGRCCVVLKAVLLRVEGEACELCIGDRICLLSTDTSNNLELQEAHDGGHPQELTVNR